MTQPLLSLLATVGVVALAVLLFWPTRGWYWRWMRAWRATERVLSEDALKHLFDCEYHGRTANLQSLSGALSVSGNRAAEILARLQERELVVEDAGRLRLTGEGRRYALRIVRAHRLWERYLSEETGHRPEVWHESAEQLEHTLSSEEVEELSASMGHPRFDPHGDPIPTAGGEIAPREGSPLSGLKAGDIGEIVHIEDEPDAVYAQLVAEGLYLGMTVRVIEVTPQRITFEADSEEHVLAPVLAANLSVVPLPTEEAIDGSVTRLSSLETGQSGRVVAFTPALRGPQRRRMFDLGFIPGTEVRAEIRSPGGDPTGYAVRGAVIALRKSQADQVQIEPLEPASAQGEAP